MNGIHDMGGMHGFGPIVRETDEQVFHHEWERRMFALALAIMGRRTFNVDELRHSIERMPADQYLRASYYERWLHALVTLLDEKGIIPRAEFDAAVAAAANSAAPPIASGGNGGPRSFGAGASAARESARSRARFRPGQRVIARNLNPPGHTRLPRYARGHRGVIRHDWGVFVFPDTHAHGLGANPQHCYAVEFDGRELWGREHPGRECVLIDLWEDYLAAAPANGSRAKPRSASAKAAKAAPKSAAARGKRIASPKQMLRKQKTVPARRARTAKMRSR